MKSKRAKITKRVVVFLFFTLSFLLAGPPSVPYAATDKVTVTASSPPVIVETDPAIYPSEEVPVSQTIRITFSQDMNPETTQSAFALDQLFETGDSQQVEGNCRVEGKVLTFAPSTFLTVGSIYQVTVSQNATDIRGQKLQGVQNGPAGEGDIRWHFVTVADNTPPEITDCSPASEATGILPRTDITFLIRDNKAGVDPSSLTLKINGNRVTPSSITSVSKTDLQVIYSPLTPFGDGKKVTVSIQAKDFVDNSVDYSYSFTTLRQLDQFWSEDGETMKNIAAMSIDGQDHLWVALRQAADGEGVVKMFDGSRWCRYTSVGGPGSDSATAIAVDSHNQVWVGLDTDSDPGADPNVSPKLARFDGKTWTLYSAQALNVPPDEEINEIAVGSHDHLWIATTQSGVIEFYNGSGLHRGLEADNLEDIQVRAIAIDKNGDIWAGTASYGIMRLHGEVWEQYVYSIHAKDPVDFIVNDLAVDDHGKVWVATNSGLLELVPNTGSGLYQWTHFIPNAFVNAVAVDRRSGYVWIGTKEEGLIRFDGQSNWVNYSTEEPNYPLSTRMNPYESITHIAINPNTKHYEIWVAGSTSLARRDENPPRVASSSPAAGANNVSKNTSVKVIFTEAMDPGSTGFFGLYAHQVRVSGTAAIEGSVLTFTLTPSSALKEGETYTLKADCKMRDLAGNRLDGDNDGLGGEEEDTFSVSFTVEKKVAPPVPPASNGGWVTPSSGGWGLPSVGAWNGAGFGLPGFNTGFFSGMPSLFSPFNFAPQWSWSPFDQLNAFNVFPQFGINTQPGLQGWNSGLFGQPFLNTIPSPFGWPLF